MNKGNHYRKTSHGEKGWLIEAPFIHMPRGIKHWAKKYLSRRERYVNTRRRKDKFYYDYMEEVKTHD